MLNLNINPGNYPGNNDPLQQALAKLGLQSSVQTPGANISSVAYSGDSFVRSTNNIGIVRINNQDYYITQPTDEILYNPQDGKVYLARSTANGLALQPLDFDKNGQLFFPITDKVPIARDSQGRQQVLNTGTPTQSGDQLFYDENTGRLYIQRQGANGLEEIDLDRATNGDLVPNNLTQATSAPVDVQKEVSRISSQAQTFSALGLPPELTTSYVDVSGVVPGFGDQTGATIAAGIYVEASLYNQLQKTISIINYLNTAPNGTAPNPNFSYISGRPPYAQDTPEGRKAQEKVFAALRTNIIAQLTRIAEQIKDSITGLRQQTDAAQAFKGRQDGEVAKWVKEANSGGNA
ncbi:MAG: hypothetical protein SFU25_06760 [Candidatus Caenarcaniphilales bacterium]|nr:hypothetical protein [Candidatus Caenarcaniphilales bacterium]